MGYYWSRRVGGIVYQQASSRLYIPLFIPLGINRRDEARRYTILLILGKFV